jgi:hypothetical protein
MAIHVGDIGTLVTVDVVGTISTGTTFNLEIVKPSGAEDTWVGALSGTTDIVYTIVDGDLDEAGQWQIQPYVVLSGGWSGRGDKTQFKVEPKIHA